MSSNLIRRINRPSDTVSRQIEKRRRRRKGDRQTMWYNTFKLYRDTLGGYDDIEFIRRIMPLGYLFQGWNLYTWKISTKRCYLPRNDLPKFVQPEDAICSKRESRRAVGTNRHVVVRRNAHPSHLDIGYLNTSSLPLWSHFSLDGKSEGNNCPSNGSVITTDRASTPTSTRNFTPVLSDMHTSDRSVSFREEGISSNVDYSLVLLPYNTHVISTSMYPRFSLLSRLTIKLF